MSDMSSGNKRSASDASLKDSDHDHKKVRPHACVHCRRLKMKCEFDESQSPSICTRCLKTDKQCYFEEKGRGKRQTEKVAELEAALSETRSQLSYLVNNLGSATVNGIASNISNLPRVSMPSDNLGLLANTAASTSPASLPPPNTPPSQHAQRMSGSFNIGTILNQPVIDPNLASPVSTKSNMLPPKFEKFHPSKFFNKPVGWHVPDKFGALDLQAMDYTFGQTLKNLPDIITRNVITLDAAHKAYDYFFENIYKSVPVCLWSHHNQFTALRQSSPLLFLCIVAVASRWTSDYATYQHLTSHLMRAVSDRVVFHGEKSLHNVQALLLISAYSPTTARFEHTQAWMLRRMAINMAIDININRHSVEDDLESADSLSNPEHLTRYDQKRTWLLCFACDIAYAMGMRRPLCVSWNRCLDDFLKDVEIAAKRSPPGLVLEEEAELLNRVRLHRIMYRVMENLQTYDIIMKRTTLDSSIEYILRGFNREMDDFWIGIPPWQKNDHLLIHYYYAKAFLNELSIIIINHEGYTGEDGKNGQVVTLDKAVLAAPTNYVSLSLAITSSREVLQAAHRYAKTQELGRSSDYVFFMILYASMMFIKVGAKVAIHKRRSAMGHYEADARMLMVSDVVGSRKEYDDVLDLAVEALATAAPADGVHIAANFHKMVRAVAKAFSQKIEACVPEMPPTPAESGQSMGNVNEAATPVMDLADVNVGPATWGGTAAASLPIDIAADLAAGDLSWLTNDSWWRDMFP